MKVKVNKKIGMKLLNKLNSFTNNYEAVITKKDIEITLSHKMVIEKLVGLIQGTALDGTIKLTNLKEEN